MRKGDDVLAIELLASDPLVAELEQIDSVQIVKKSGFDGSELVIVLAALAAGTIAQIASIIKKAIDQQKHISVKYKGVEIHGASEDKLIEILRALNKT
jgi:hypothetical protein